MRHNFKLAAFAAYLAIFTICSPAFARPPCLPSSSKQPDVTSTIPCRRVDSDLLDFIANAEIPRSGGFVAIQHFAEGKPISELQITWIGSNFRHHFLPKSEPQQTSRVLDVFRLRTSVSDRAILDTLGADPETSLYDVWTLLSKQSHGEAGPLRTDGLPNVFYVRDGQDQTWTVDTVWSGAGWEVGASRLNSVMRESGAHVFAR